MSRPLLIALAAGLAGLWALAIPGPRLLADGEVWKGRATLVLGALLLLLAARSVRRVVTGR